ncbi:MAG: PD40 domain-containing protein ['Candidatus Kapabacteria' thiocyanatum]|uniref:Peptidase MA-like domain-containing protein n=1 Tax=Candidatus Kapaibacterium thiocyanatum TaxID=1895771 RepID=A0A1M3L260_9BACT|nr:PD40 domain-containing protein ['Candidatus Kapabacteria' thiocyanatum]OJX59322.1 MAG: hypothetical protein BGO89_02575 ['Candidatus Kapabacteria' thiocyanatum]
MRRLTSLSLLLMLAVAPMLAQIGGSLPFGKNKVQYEKFKWRFIQSENFDVYFHEGGEYAAKFTALKAEKALTEIEGTLTYSITKRIVFIVYNSHNQFQQTNVLDEFMSEGIGGVTELFKNRIVIPFEGDYQKFAHVIHHELVHAVLNDMFYGGSIQSLLSNNVRAIIPIWMNEGFAEYSSTGGLDIKTDQFMRDVAVSEYLRGLNQLNGYFAYRGGQAFWWYVAEKYGKGKVGEVFNRFRSIGDVNQTFRAAFGMTYEEMSDQWAKDIKKFYFPDVDKYEYVEDYSTRLTNHQKEDNFYNTSPAVSPDGERVAFISDRDGTFGLYVMELATKKVRKLQSSGRSTDFEELNFLTPGISWDPAGKRLAVGAKSGGQDALYIIDVDGGGYDRKEFGFQTMGGVSWSPDGKYIVFDAAPGGTQSDLYAYGIDNDSLRQLTNDVFTDMEPAWAPDGRTIYFISDRGRFVDGGETIDNFAMWTHDVSQRDIYSITLDSGSIRRITNDPSVGKYSIVVAPDHRSILYVADYNGIGNLWELSLATGERHARTNSLQEVSQISITKDGTKMLFSSQNRVGYDLFLLKFPFEQKERDTLPLTKFRQQELDNRNSLSAIMLNLDAPRPDSVAAYGNFDIDFSRQKVVPPNEDVVVKGATEGGNKDSVNTDFTPKDYRVSFSPDVITGNAGYSNWYGAQGTAQMLFTDMMGDHEIYFQANLFLDLSNSNFYLSYGYLPDIVDYRVAAFHNAGYTYIGSVLFRLRNYGMTLWGSYPFSRYSRFDLGIQAMAMSRENIDFPTSPSLSRFVTVPQASYVYDNTLQGFWAPVDGTRANLTVEGSPKLGNNGLGFVTLRTDLREYIHLGGAYSIALRGAGGMSMGANPQKFFIGGTDNWFNRFFSANGWPFVNPEDFAFTRPGWPLRGWGINERYGSKYFIGNAEFRFPLLFAFQAGPIPALFQGLQAQLFLDMGGAFDDGNRAYTPDGNIASNPILYSTGFGIRSLALGLPLRFDVAWRREASGIFSQPVYLFSLGADF